MNLAGFRDRLSRIFDPIQPRAAGDCERLSFFENNFLGKE